MELALGDFNKDGLLDIYFTANQKKNKLYLNEGGMKFRDITMSAGVEGKKAWSTGVSLVDINGDGLLDIYVCNSGDTSRQIARKMSFLLTRGTSRFGKVLPSMGWLIPGFLLTLPFLIMTKTETWTCTCSITLIRPLGVLTSEEMKDQKRSGGRR